VGPQWIPPTWGYTNMLARRFLAGSLLIALGVSACGQAAPAAPPVQPTAEPALRVSGSGAALPLVRKLAEAYQAEQPDAGFQFDAGTNSGGGIQGVLQGTLDLSVANRPLTDQEATESLVVNPFARDAVVFAAHTPGRAQGLSTSQAQAIYGGTIHDWEQMDSLGGPILVLDRDPDEPQRSLFLLKLLDGQPVQARSTVLTSAGDMLQALDSTPDSLGYSTLALLRIKSPASVTVLPLDGVVPGSESLRSGAYPWYLTYSLINRPEASPAVGRFLDFVHSARGQRVLEQFDTVAAAS
jgi:phosphate transport system substrate-binding protein